ncbi:MAG: hypothetical protein BJ554DRAFT_8009, partial [Olpidium bornovanus]
PPGACWAGRTVAVAVAGRGPVPRRTLPPSRAHTHVSAFLRPGAHGPGLACSPRPPAPTRIPARTTRRPPYPPPPPPPVREKRSPGA